MPSVARKPKLLIVDTTPAMAQVLKTYTELNDYEADVFSDSEQACAALVDRFTNPATDGYGCMVFGWPTAQSELVSNLVAELISPDHADLPVIVLTDEPDRDVQTLVRRRRNTRTMLWHEYNHLSSMLQSVVIKEEPLIEAPELVNTVVTEGFSASEIVEPDAVAVNANYAHVSKDTVRESKIERGLPTSILLVDNAPEKFHSLKQKLTQHGYTVAISATAASARAILTHRKFDLVVTNFSLHNESSEDFCRFMQSLQAARHPAYVLMAQENHLHAAEALGVAVGAVACLNRSESTQQFFTGLNTIASNLKSRKIASTVQATPSTVNTVPVKSAPAVPFYNAEVDIADPYHSDPTSGLKELLESSSAPSILIDGEQNIIATNKQAANVLSGGDQVLLESQNFERTVHGAPVRLSPDQPVRALFRNLDGEAFSVTYRSRLIDGSEYSLSGNAFLLTFDAGERKTTPVYANPDQRLNTVEARTSAADIETALAESFTANDHATSDQQVAAPTVDVASMAGIDVLTDLNPGVRQGVTQSAAPENVVAITGERSGSVFDAITTALSSDIHRSAYSVLMLDIKMVAAATGDRLSLGKSHLMTEMVEGALARYCDATKRLEHLGDGKFVVLCGPDKPQHSRSEADKLVAQVPDLLQHLTDIELLSHASYVDLSDSEGNSAAYILKHCTAACMKSELDGLDNTVFDINASGKLHAIAKPGIKSNEKLSNQPRLQSA